MSARLECGCSILSPFNWRDPRRPTLISWQTVNATGQRSATQSEVRAKHLQEGKDYSAPMFNTAETLKRQRRNGQQ